MQEIRDYVFGLLGYKYNTWLFKLREHKRKWEAVDIGSMEKIESLVAQWKGDTDSYHIIGGVKCGIEENLVTEAPPYRIYDKILFIATPNPNGAITESDAQTPIVAYSTWGIWYDEPNWILLGVGLPKVEYLEKLKLRGKFDKIRVCKYIPELKCLESCEMILWDKEGNKLI
jgi:hypothetical protein